METIIPSETCLIPPVARLLSPQERFALVREHGGRISDREVRISRDGFAAMVEAIEEYARAAEASRILEAIDQEAASVLADAVSLINRALARGGKSIDARVTANAREIGALVREAREIHLGIIREAKEVEGDGNLIVPMMPLRFALNDRLTRLCALCGMESGWRA